MKKLTTYFEGKKVEMTFFGPDTDEISEVLEDR